MASATGIPENHPVEDVERDEDEPLLGEPGDVQQKDTKGIQFNLIMGTAAIAQAGIWIFTAIIWAAAFMAPVSLFSAHPLLNSAGVLFTTQAILILQPTHLPKQKKQGANIHAVLNATAFLSLLAGLIIIEYNKIGRPHHFANPHVILGIITYVVLTIQVLMGFTMYYTQSIYGSTENAKAIWKYHRMSGYLLLTLFFATISASVTTDFNKNVLHMKLWPLLVAAALVVVGVGARVKKQKLGFK